MTIESALAAQLENSTAWRFSVALGVTFSPRFFCCTDPNELGIVDGKEPVAVISGGGTIVEGGSITFDGSDSYDPDGTVTGYNWSFGGGSPSSSTSSSQAVTFASAGTYTISLTVEDGTGLRSVPAKKQIQVVTAEEAFGGALAGGVYAAMETGVQYTEDSGQSWATRQGGLSGDGLKVRDLSQDPATFGLPNQSTVWWAATDGGLYVSIDGGQNWAQSDATDLFVSLQWFGDILYAAANPAAGTPTIYWANVSTARTGGAARWSEV